MLIGVMHPPPAGTADEWASPPWLLARGIAFMSTRRRFSLILPVLAPLLGPWAPPARAGYSLLVSSVDTNSILRYDGLTGEFLGAFVPNDANSPIQPFGIAYGPDDNLYVASAVTHDVFRYDGRTGAPLPAPGRSGAIFVPGSEVQGFPFSITFGPDGNLYVAGSVQVFRFDGTTGATIDTFVAPHSGGLDFPSVMTFGPDGHFYVSSGFTNEVLRYDGATGAFLDTFIAAGSGGLDEPKGLLFKDGLLYVASYLTNSVLRYNAATGAYVDTFIPSGSGGLNWATWIAFGPDGHFYITGDPDGPVMRYDGATGAFLGIFVQPGSGGIVRSSLATFTDLAVPAPPSLTLFAVGAGLLAARLPSRLRRPKRPDLPQG
jgi:WD40 repeat protein